MQASAIGVFCENLIMVLKLQAACFVTMCDVHQTGLVLTFYSQVVAICTASLTFNNSTFCPHSVFMCFVWISEQTAIISLYNIN